MQGREAGKPTATVDEYVPQSLDFRKNGSASACKLAFETLFKWKFQFLNELRICFFFFFPSKEKEKTSHVEEFLLAKKMENLLTLWNLLRKLLQDHHFAIWGKISTFPTGLNVALSVSTALQSPQGNFPLNLLGQSSAAQQKYQVWKQNIRVSESSCGPCNWGP